MEEILGWFTAEPRSQREIESIQFWCVYLVIRGCPNRTVWIKSCNRVSFQDVIRKSCQTRPLWLLALNSDSLDRKDAANSQVKMQARTRKASLGLKVILTSSNTSKSMSLWLCHIYHIHIFKPSWKNWKDSAFKAFQNHSDCSVIPSATMTLQGSLCCHLSTTPGCSKCLALSRISSPEFRHIVSNASKCRCIGINDVMQRCF